MRLAFFSPLPPLKSGTADYSAALLKRLREQHTVDVFEDSAGGFDPGAYDIALYQLGNNPHHACAYQTALEHPGVTVLHEANLHHLIANLTIKRGDWDAYLREVEYDGGEEALEYASRVRALEVGPDYEGVPMLRRILERSKAIIVHSRFMEEKIRQSGFNGSLARIPHGAWTPQADRMGYRHKLGLDVTTPLIGVFGFLKPYKRISQSLRAFRRLLRVEPRAKMILVGETHPDLPLGSIIQSLDLSNAARQIGYAPMADFTGYMAACDIVLNLRYPTVGESSGTMLRSMGLGRATVVSDVGSFQELPSNICLKVPVDATEENLIFEYLNLLVSRPDLRECLGKQAHQWVRQECNWDLVAGYYSSFLESVISSAPWQSPRQKETSVASPTAVDPVPEEYILGWSESDTGIREYAVTHMTRLQKTLEIIPPGSSGDRILEMGAYLQIAPALKAKLGYGEVRGCYYGPPGKVNHRSITSDDGQKFECDIDLFNAEKDSFPYPEEHFSTVLCCELIEHLAEDPMHMMAEINRILKPGGHIVLTTPNIASLRAIAAILQGYHPGFFPAYIQPQDAGEEAEARHNREYTPREVARLLVDSGFEITLLETGPFRDKPKPEHAWVVHLLERYGLSGELRGDGIYAVGQKSGGVRHRHPDWLYS